MSKYPGCLCTLICLVGCGGDGKTAADADVDAQGPPLPVASVGIVGAASLVMAPQPQAARTSASLVGETTYLLQRVNADGTVGDVTVTNADGNPVASSVRVASILDAADHVVMQLHIATDHASFRPIVLVGKSDGAAFEVSEAVTALGCQNTLLQYEQAPYNFALADDHGGVYFAAPCGQFGGGNLIRIDTVASPPTATFALPSDTVLWDWAVDAAGNIAYISAPGGSPSIWRARGATGQTKNLVEFKDPFTGPEGLVHFIGGTVDACTSSEGCTTDLVVSGSTIDVAIGAQGGALPNLDGKFARITSGSDVFFVSSYTQMQFGGPIRVSRWRAGQTDAYSTQWPDHTIRAAAGSSTHVFVAALDATQNPQLAKFAMADLAAPPTDVIPSGTYDIVRLSASPAGTLTFAGLRLSDSKEVVGRISPAGDVTIVSEYVAPVGLLVPI